jgi:hypothetical protein
MRCIKQKMHNSDASTELNSKACTEVTVKSYLKATRAIKHANETYKFSAAFADVFIEFLRQSIFHTHHTQYCQVALIQKCCSAGGPVEVAKTKQADVKEFEWIADYNRDT